MTTYVPKLLRKVVASRATQDLIVPSGDWVLIFQDTDEIITITDEQFTTSFRPEELYDTDDEQEETQPKDDEQEETQPKVRKPPSGNAKGKDVDPDVLMSTQGGRFFYILLQLGSATRQEVERYVKGKDSPKSVGPNFSTMVKLELISTIPDPDPNGKGYPIYTPTPLGIEIFRHQGMYCFTRVPMVPPVIKRRESNNGASHSDSQARQAQSLR